jgi:RimJ/RimL family protein N-acetyltransferase
MPEMIHWPLASLELVTPRLRLHVPSPAELDELAALAAAGVHEPQRQPFTVAWTDGEPEAVARRVLQYAWGTWSRWAPEDWSLWLAVVHDGTVIGSQEVSGRDFAVRCEVSTGSWLGRKFHGNGFGTEMRAAVLHLAFAGLGARCAVSGAYLDNAASLAVSRKLGYREDGIESHSVRGAEATMRRLRLTRADWQAHRSAEVRIDGLEACLPMFGTARPSPPR